MLLICLVCTLSAYAKDICSLEKNDCPNGYVCMNWTDGPECKEKPEVAPMNFVLPFDSSTEVVCTHAYGVGSHSWPNAFYSLDLATPYEKDPSIIRASADGIAYVFMNENEQPCKNPPGVPSKAEIDNCGLSWGNRVKLLHDKGYFSFYVHLDEVFVKTGDRIKSGQALGTEGWTGAAGHRHLHWSVQKIEYSNQKELEERIRWDGISVPFRFKTLLNGKAENLNTESFNCQHANIGQVTNQPRLKGVN